MELKEGTAHVTRGGSKVIIYSDGGRGERNIHGAYFTGEEWIPTTWLHTGRFHEEHKRALDIIGELNPEPQYA